MVLLLWFLAELAGYLALGGLNRHSVSVDGIGLILSDNQIIEEKSSGMPQKGILPISAKTP